MPEVRLIDAVALIQNHCGACANKEFCAEESCPYYEIRRRIELAPTIEAEPIRHGRWDNSPTGNKNYKYCSECGGCFYMPSPKVIYCPYCSAKMDAADTNVLTNDGGAENG